MTAKKLTGGLVLVALVLCAGCISPMSGQGARNARQQLGIANAAKDALQKPKIQALLGMKVWVDVAGISGSQTAGVGSEDAHFLKNMIIETLVGNGVTIVERREAEAVLRAIAEVMGTDTVARVFPHALLPLMYYISHTARVKIHLYAYETKDPNMIMADDCEGTYSWSEWSFLGLGPFR